MRPLGALTMAFLLAGAGCSGEDHGGFGGAPVPGQTSPAAPVPSVPGRANRGSVTVVAPGGLRFSPERIRLRPGERTTFTFENRDGQTHTFTVNELNLLMQARAGETVRLTLEVPFSFRGRVPFFCSIPGHRQGGMEGTAVVR